MYDSIDLLTDLTQNFHECTPQHTNASIFNSESYRSLNSFPFAVFSVLNYSLPSRSGSQHRFYYRRRAETALPCALPNFRPHQSNEKKRRRNRVKPTSRQPCYYFQNKAPLLCALFSIGYQYYCYWSACSACYRILPYYILKWFFEYPPLLPQHV